MRFKKFDLIGYRHNQTVMLSFYRKVQGIPMCKLTFIKRGQPIKLKITSELVNKVKIKQEIRQTEFKGYVRDGVHQLADVIEEKIITMGYYESSNANWNDWIRVFAYEYLYDVAFDRGIKQERERKRSKNHLGVLTGNDIEELALQLQLPASKVDHAVMEIVARKQGAV